MDRLARLEAAAQQFAIRRSAARAAAEHDLPQAALEVAVRHCWRLMIAVEMLGRDHAATRALATAYDILDLASWPDFASLGQVHAPGSTASYRVADGEL